eukprot:1863107-Lingulodinium_polyedra.AAC.1
MARDLRAVAVASGLFDRIIVQRLQNVTQWCGWDRRPPLQRLANRTLKHSMRAPEKWRARGVRGRAI